MMPTSIGISILRPSSGGHGSAADLDVGVSVHEADVMVGVSSDTIGDSSLSDLVGNSLNIDGEFWGAVTKDGTADLGREEIVRIIEMKIESVSVRIEILNDRSREIANNGGGVLAIIVDETGGNVWGVVVTPFAHSGRAGGDGDSELHSLEFGEFGVPHSSSNCWFCSRVKSGN